MFYAHLEPAKQFEAMRDIALSEMTPELREFCTTNKCLHNTLREVIMSNIFYNIPFHYGFRITQSGRVADLLKMIEIAPTLNKLGYYAVTTRPDGAFRSVTSHVHRLLALAFIPPMDYRLVSELQVNHIDGNKLNNSLQNLEWVTHQRNCQHAYETGLRSDNTPIEIIDAVTGTVRTVYSMGEAGRFFGVTAAAIHFQLNSRISAGPYKGHFLRYADGRIVNSNQVPG